MTSLLTDAWAYVNRVCGFDTLDAFPPDHPYARTRWNKAYFDIASDVKPERIERIICDAIANTPWIFMHITNPTVSMQRALIGVIGDRKRCNTGSAAELVRLLIAAYRSPYVAEPVPGLRTVIQNLANVAPDDQARTVLSFLAGMDSPFDVIEG